MRRMKQGLRKSGCPLPLWIFLILALVLPYSALAASNLTPVALRCEYLENPLGIDELKPRLTWKVESTERSQKQSAYQILVASDEKNLKEDRGNLWDPGKITSDQTVNVEY